jgi:charged multivesicular body protein 6
MGNLGSCRSDSATPDDPSKDLSQKDRAILELKRQRDRLRKAKEKMQITMNRETEIAKELYRKGEKKLAILALKKKKYQESMLSNTYNQLENIEKMISSIHEAEQNAKVFEALKVGKDALEHINSQMNVDEIEQLMADTQEAIAYQNEITQILGAALSEEDNQAVEKEYDMLMSSMQIEDNDEVGLVENLPQVPAKPVPNERPHSVSNNVSTRDSVLLASD